MALSPNLNLVRVTGWFVDANGAPAEGDITFKLSTRLTDLAQKQIILATPVVATLIGGMFALDLPATDDPDLTPTDNYYTVSITLKNQAPITHNLVLPYDTTGPVDLSEVLPVVSSTPIPQYLLMRIAAMTDVSLVGLNLGYTLTWSGTQWVPKPVPVVVRQNGTNPYPARPAAEHVVWKGRDEPATFGTGCALEGDEYVPTLT